MLLAGWAVPGAGQEAAQRLGPSFACPASHDPLGRLICDSDALSRRDLEFVQAFQALRQQSPPARQAALRAEAAEFGRTLRTTCAIPAQGDAPASAAECVGREYGRQRAVWAARLEGAAQQEARRGLDQQVALQGDLRRIGLLAPDHAIDGVYGASTRVAIAAFQQTMGLAPSGLLGDADALALTKQSAAHGGEAGQAGAGQAGAGQAGSAAARSGWEDLQARAKAAGVAVVVAPSGPCVVGLQVRDPDALATAAGPRAETGKAEGVFAAQVAFLRTEMAARTVHAFYAVQPAVDRCRFEAAAFTTDLYGRDVAQPLFAFEFDRATFDKVVWSRFDPANMPRIVMSFEYEGYSRQRLRAAGVDVGPAHDEPPAPAPAPAPVAPVQAAGDVAVAHWAGSATMTTRPFHVDGPWEVRWHSDGAFSAVVHPVGAATTTVVAKARKQGESSAYQPGAGDFFLEVDASSPWTVEVVRVAALP